MPRYHYFLALEAKAQWEDACRRDNESTSAQLSELLDRTDALLEGQQELKQLMIEAKKSRNRLSTLSLGDPPATVAASTAPKMPWEINRKELKKDTHENEDGVLEVNESIDDGTQGSVFKGKYRGAVVAIKVMDIEMSAKAFDDEVSIISKLSHPNVCRFIGACKIPKRNYISKGEIALEFLSQNLSEAIHHGPTPLTGEEKLMIAIGTADGMKYLHSERPKIVHLDLKPKNICLMERTLKPKIIDFGLAKAKGSEQRYAEDLTAAGTLVYMAPEFLADSRGGPMVDVYSYGVTIWEMYARQLPLPEETESTLRRSVPKGLRPTPFDDTSGLFPPVIKKLIQDCWNTKPAKRPVFGNVSLTLTALSMSKVVVIGGGGGGVSKGGGGSGTGGGGGGGAAKAAAGLPEKGPTRAEYLKKMSGGKSRSAKWDKRWCELSDTGHINYFKKKGGKIAGAVPLLGCPTKVNPEDPTTFFVEEPERLWVFQAQTAADCALWLRDIRVYSEDI